MTDGSQALSDLEALVSFGIRFHGSGQIHDASRWIEKQLQASGLSVDRQAVALPGWEPGTATVRVLAPVERELPAWPMLWSGGSGGPLRGRVAPLGPQGIWGDSITWTRFVVADDDSRVIGYLHGRDVGPAAPQPLPSGADVSVAQLAIGHLDGLQLAEWLGEGRLVEVEIDCSSGPAPEFAIADNLVVDMEAPEPRDADRGVVIVCAHYDSFFNTVGAYDNGSGTIALLHLARRWAVQGPPRAVRLIWFTAEEWHLGGSRHYVHSLTRSDLDRIAYVFNLDGLGRGRFVETFGAPESFATAFHQELLQYAEGNVQTRARFPPTTGTDDASFYRAGVPSLYMTINDLHRLHQPDDLPNDGIGASIAWVTEFVEHALAVLPDPQRDEPPGIL